MERPACLLSTGTALPKRYPSSLVLHEPGMTTGVNMTQK